MKKSTVTIVIVVIIIIIGILVFGHSSNNPFTPNPTSDIGTGNPESTTTPSIPVASSVTTQVSSKISTYKNDELGFSVNYPNAWEKSEVSNGVSFIMPIDRKSRRSPSCKQI